MSLDPGVRGVALADAAVVVVGDGPAGSALARALHRRGVSTVLLGDDRPWEATYGAWRDDIEGVLGLDVASVAATEVETVAVAGRQRREIRRPYVMFDNTRLRAALRAGTRHVIGRVTAVGPHACGRIVRFERDTDDTTAPNRDDQLVAGLVIDATGTSRSFGGGHPRPGTGRDGPAWQTAFGVVLAERPDGDLGRPTLMDFRGDGPPGDLPTFVYALPVADGWLVEETVLAARPAVEPLALAPRLAARLGLHTEDMLAAAVRTEYVRIPMGGPLPDRRLPVVAFGAAAGMIHPATGFSVAASLRAADRVAAAVERALEEGLAGQALSDAIWDAVWPARLRATRRWHDIGLDALIGLDRARTQDFFEAFFELPVERWAPYMRIDTDPTVIRSTMLAVFGAVPWSVRRRLMRVRPRRLVPF